jgi:tRNA(fMet)-specific endonuclease VapC
VHLDNRSDRIAGRRGKVQQAKREPAGGRSAARLEVLSFDDDAADHAADIRATLEQRGQAIGGYDTLIAGHARRRGLIVVTGNLRQFSRVERLRTEDWLGNLQLP